MALQLEDALAQGTKDTKCDGPIHTARGFKLDRVIPNSHPGTTPKVPIVKSSADAF